MFFHNVLLQNIIPVCIKFSSLYEICRRFRNPGHLPALKFFQSGLPLLFILVINNARVDIFPQVDEFALPLMDLCLSPFAHDKIEANQSCNNQADVRIEAQ